MKVTEEQIIELKSLKNAYGEMHQSMNELETKIQNLMTERTLISEELIRLRDTEIGIINKIEKDSGEKVTTDYLMEILK